MNRTFAAFDVFQRLDFYLIFYSDNKDVLYQRYVSVELFSVKINSVKLIQAIMNFTTQFNFVDTPFTVIYKSTFFHELFLHFLDILRQDSDANWRPAKECYTFFCNFYASVKTEKRICVEQFRLVKWLSKRYCRQRGKVLCDYVILGTWWPYVLGSRA